MSETVRYRESSSTKTVKSTKPVTIEWKKARMVRSHSIKAASHEILTMSTNTDVVKVNIVGDTGSGKTVLATTLAHLLHTESKVPYAVKILSKEHLLNIRDFVATLEATNYILIFDDISFISAIASQNKIKQIEQTFTELRHLPGGVDIKIIAIFNFHYTMAVSKYLRQSNAHFYTTVGSSDKDNLIGIVGKGYIRKIEEFIKIRSQAISTSKYTIHLGNKGNKFTYDYMKPFAPAFYYNGSTARLVAFPLRSWIQPLCETCASSEGKNIVSDFDIEAFDQAIRTKFGTGCLKQALRLKLYMAGISTYGKNVKRALTFIDKWSAKNKMNLEQLARFYELTDVKANLHVDADVFEPKLADTSKPDTTLNPIE